MIGRRSFLKAAGVSAASLATGSGIAHAIADVDWGRLASALEGRLIRPQDSEYLQVVVAFFRQFDDRSPQAVAMCRSASDVQACLAFVQEAGVEYAIRGGGHSYQGYSNTSGLQIDLGEMNKISYDDKAGVVSVGAGVRSGQLPAALSPYGVMIPAPRCPAVGMSGFTLGGGLGFYGRKYGLASDRLIETELVTADRRILTCDEAQNADAFWALRGGGGGNFGVNTEFKFKPFDVRGPSTIFQFLWKGKDPAPILVAVQEAMSSAPHDLSSVAMLQVSEPLSTGKPERPELTLQGHYFGRKSHVRDILQPVIGRWRPTRQTVAEVGFWQANTFLAHSMAVTGLTASKSSFLPAVSEAMAAQAVSAVSEWPGSSLPEAGYAFLLWGGAYNEPKPSDTAFVHRNAESAGAWITSWSSGDPRALVKEGDGWLMRSWEASQKYALPQSYQNIADTNMPNWLGRFYGKNLERLVEVKRKYDPEKFFDFPMAIPTQR